MGWRSTEHRDAAIAAELAMRLCGRRNLVRSFNLDITQIVQLTSTAKQQWQSA